MPFIGNQLSTSFQNVETQTITGDGSTSYTLNNAVADGKDLLVYINNVKQEEGSGKSYTATGTTITFTEAVASTDSCYVVFIGQAIGTVTPKDGSIVSSMLADANLEMPNTLDLNGKELILDADADTSITADTDDTIDIKIAGTDNTHLIATGVGIGVSPTTSYGRVTQVHDTGTSGANLRLTDSTSGSGTGNGFEIIQIGVNDYIINRENGFISIYTNNAEAMRIESGGNVGIGTTSPNNKLDVNGGIVCSPNTDGKDTFQLSTNDVDEGRLRIKNVDTITVQIRAGGDTYFNGGNVAIGTTAPTQKLTVNAGSTDTAVAVFTGNDTNRGLKISTATANSQTDMLAVLEAPGQHSGSYEGEISFKTANTERMRIDKSGAVRIANTSGTLYNSSSATGTVASTSLQVSTDGSTVGYFNRLNSIGQILGFYNDGTQIGQINVGTLSNAGRILIGNSNCNLLFNDAVPEIVPASSNGVKRDGSIDFGNATGRFQDIRATNGTIQTSDKNEKNTIVDSDLGIDFVNRLSPKSYKFNNKTRTHYGLIAQDVETVLGDIKKDASQFAGFCKDDISEKQDGSEYRYGLRYTQFISPMIQAIKDLNAEVDTLKAKVKALEAK